MVGYTLPGVRVNQLLFLSATQVPSQYSVYFSAARNEKRVRFLEIARVCTQVQADGTEGLRMHPCILLNSLLTNSYAL